MHTLSNEPAVRRRYAFALAAIAAALLSAACGRVREERVNVLLVTLDTTRADRLGCYGNERIETPHLDRLAREGVRFERAYTAVPSTLPSHCSILTGMYPARHGVHDNGVYVLPAQVATLAQSFRAAGYRTAAFVSAFVLDAQFGLARGFDLYDDEMEQPLLEGDPARIRQLEGLSEDERRWLIQQASPYQRRADSVTPRALDWLAEEPGEPFFLWVHYFDPHMDYTPPPPWDRRYDPDYDGPLDGRAKTFHLVSTERGWGGSAPLPEGERQHMIARYDGEVSFMDEWIGRLLAGVEGAGAWDRTLVVVVADHGEGFGEHGQLWEHNGDVFDEVMRVPLLLRLPHGRGAGNEVPELVRTIDLAPTVLEVSGLPPLPESQGISLLPLALREPGAPRPTEALLEALREEQASPSPFSWLGLCRDRYKLALLFDERGAVAQSALFDLETDPFERRSVEAEHPDLSAELRARTLDSYQRMKSAAAPDSRRGMDELTSEALRALGYTGD